MRESTLRTPRAAGDADRRANREQQILDAAAKLFAERGYSETDTQLLAEKLHVGKGTLYRYFPSKRQLFLAAADRVMQRLRQAIDGSMEGIDDPLDRVAAAIRACLAFFDKHPEFVELLIQERAQFKDRKKPTYFEHREAHVERWRNFYRSLIADGRIRDVPVDRITDVLSDLIYGNMFTNYFAGQRKPFEEQAQDIIDIVYYGILSEQEREVRRGQETRAEREESSAEDEGCAGREAGVEGGEAENQHAT
jgi:AcrR family transcriptional regulator